MSVFVSASSTLLAAISAAQAAAPAIDSPPSVEAASSRKDAGQAPAAAPEATPQTPVAEPAQAADPLHPDVIVIGRERGYAPDPARAINLQSFKATNAVDNAITGPIAMAYKKTVPSPFRQGVHNVIYNLREPVVFVNFVLQHKIGKAAETVGRFAINTVAGVAGIFDIAKRRPFKLPRRSNGFSNTLGFYGVAPGPFMYLPLVGPTTVRDLFGGAVDRLILPVALGSRVRKPAVVIPMAVLGVLDHRSEFDDTLQALRASPDPYASTRDFYLKRRQAEIDHLRGRDVPGYSPMSEAPKGPIVLHGQVLTPDTPSADARE